MRKLFIFNRKKLCPCCKQFRLNEIGKYEICPICKWEDDPAQRKDITYFGGANKLSLEEARKAYKGGQKNE